MRTGLFWAFNILHPNNVGRCGHIANASYAVATSMRGCGVGELLVRDSLVAGAALGFRILQFNAVVCTNKATIRLYEKLGFVRLGIIPDGLIMPRPKEVPGKMLLREISWQSRHTKSIV